MTDLGTVFVLVVGGGSIALYVTFLAGYFAATKQPRGAPPRGSGGPPQSPPLVSILRPLAGADDNLADNLTSLARLDYPRYELLLGIASLDDAAVPVARAFLRAHPELSARLVVTNPHAATNPKVAQLIGLERLAKGELIWISDSNVRVAPPILSGLVAALQKTGVGMASNVVVGTGERTLGAALENLQICAQIAPSVLSFYFWTGKAITVGKSMAMRRTALRAVGGFQAVAGILAEDDVLGRIFRRAGWQVQVLTETVENRNRTCGVSRTMERHTRWARMRRAVCPRGFFFEPLLCPIVMALTAFAVAPGRLTATLLALALVVETLGAYAATARLRGRLPPASFVPLEVARALLLFGCWLGAVASRTIEWRGHAFRLGPGSTLEPLPPGTTPLERLRPRARLGS